MSFLGGLIGGITGFITGGPAGALVGVAGGLVGGTSGGVQAGAGYTSPYRAPNPGAAGGLNSAALPSMPFAGSGPGFGTMTPFYPGPRGFAASSPAPAPSGGPVVVQGPDGKLCQIRGHHLNKSRYFKKRPGIIGPLVFGSEMLVEKGTECVKNRRMNVGNARALRHALRRARGFEKLAMRTIRLLHPTKRGRFGGFKTRRRASR